MTLVGAQLSRSACAGNAPFVAKDSNYTNYSCFLKGLISSRVESCRRTTCLAGASSVTLASPEATWTKGLIQAEWVQIPVYHCALPLATVSFQKKNKQQVISFTVLQTDCTGCCSKGTKQSDLSKFRMDSCICHYFLPWKKYPASSICSHCMFFSN